MLEQVVDIDTSQRDRAIRLIAYVLFLRSLRFMAARRCDCRRGGAADRARG
jgi:hypothetical protein